MVFGHALDGVSHFLALELPDATATEIERFIAYGGGAFAFGLGRQVAKKGIKSPDGLHDSSGPELIAQIPLDD